MKKLLKNSLFWGMLSVLIIPQIAQAQSPPSLGTLPSFTGIDNAPKAYSPPEYNPKNSQQFNVYRLDVGDGISVIVPDFPDFGFASLINSEGNVQVPLIGTINVVGLTTLEVENKIKLELKRRYLKEEPKVSVSLLGNRPTQLTILGEVIRPGFYVVAPNAPLTAVIGIVGGSTPRADLRSVIVRRPLVDGTILEETVDLYTPLIKGESLPNFRLQGGDTIIVSKLELGQEGGYDRRLIARTNLAQPTITVRVLFPVDPSGSTIRNLVLPNGSTAIDVAASLPTVDALRYKVEDISILRFDPAKRGIIVQSLNPVAGINGDLSQNIPLEDQDVIVVSRTLLGQVLAAFNTITQPLSEILRFYLFFNQFNNNNNNNNRNFF